MTPRGRFLAAFVVAVLAVTGCQYTSHLKLPDEQAVSSRVLWGDGSLLTRIHGVEDRDPVKLAAMAKVLPKAVVAIEDARYFEHGGFDLRGIARALTHNIEKGRAAEGGSTITQQYVRAVMLGSQKTLKRKLREAVMAMQLEDRYSKQTILERYLNTVYFGNGAYGVQAAARTYFGKDASQLDLAQSALVAGMIRSPNDYDPFIHPDRALARRNQVIDRMTSLHRIAQPEADVARAVPLDAVRQPTDTRYPAPFFVEKVKKFIFNNEKFGATTADRERKLFQGGLTIETTLDPKWQLEAETALHGVLTDPTDPPGAIVGVDPQTGWVKAYASSQDFWGTSAYAKLDLADARDPNGAPTRQPGSSFKPFTLATAIEQGIPLSKTYDGRSPRVILPGWPAPKGLENFEGTAFGRINLVDATVNSVNTVYGQLVTDVGPQNVANLANAAGITNHLDPGQSIGIGDDAVTLEDMASAYSTFDSDGMHHPEVFVTRVTDRSGRVLYENRPAPSRAFSATTARTVTAVLQQVVQRGTGINARIGRPVAGKTGTRDLRTDAWFVGYTPELVAGVWVGFPDGAPGGQTPKTRIPLQGGEWPARIWQVFASSTLADTPASLFPVPDPVSSTSSSTTTTTRPPLRPGIYSVVGLDVFRAVQSLTQDGYRVVIVRAPSRRYPPNYVTAQDPAEGASVRAGGTITLTVADGRPQVGAIPNVLGLLADQAAAAIRAAGFAPNVIVSPEPPPGTAGNGGKAWKQSPISGSDADDGSTVTVWVNP